MKKIKFSSEVLCLFFIISTSILFGKVLLDLKNIIGNNINTLIPQQTIAVNYNVYSYKEKDVIDKLNDISVMRNIDELKAFKNKLKEEKINVKWLENKLKVYEKDFFNEKTLVVISLVNDNNISITRVNNIYKKNNYITIGVTQKYKDYESTKKYTWLSVIEIEDNKSEISLDVNKIY